MHISSQMKLPNKTLQRRNVAQNRAWSRSASVLEYKWNHMNASGPNILLLNSHDSGRFFGCYGIDTCHTPHIDRFASEGTLLEQFTAASPICTPSRGAMMTGRWPQRNGLVGLEHHGFRLNPGERHAAAILRDAGYETTLFHFQHVSPREDWSELGFQEFLCRSRDEEFPVYPEMAIPAPEVGEAFAQWIAGRESEKPFFAQVNFNETHTPFHFGGVTEDRSRGVTVPPWVRRDAASEAHFAMLQGSVAALDKGIGCILDALDHAGFAKSTLVVFATDHGFEAVRDKWTCYESGIGIACILRGPGVQAGRRVSQPQSNVDLLPTLLDCAEISRPGNLDGSSFANLLREKDPQPVERPVFSIYHNTGVRSVRFGDWKLIRNFAAEPYQQSPPASIERKGAAHPRPPVELYDLATDPHEFHNLAEEHPERIPPLNKLLAEWMRDTGDPAWIG